MDTYISATGHNYDLGTISADLSKMIYNCTVCGQIKTENVYTVNYYTDGVKSGGVPDGYDFVAYVRTVDNSDWISWDYENKHIKDPEAGKTYDVYLYTVTTLYDSYDEMIASSQTGTVGTKSYYKDAGRGGAIYDKAIGSSATVVPFTVGEEKIITVDMFGAYADRDNASDSAINKALAYTPANVIEFEGKQYLQANIIWILRSDITVNGKGADIGNRYENKVGYDISIEGTADKKINNITVKNLTLTCTEDRGAGHLYNTGNHIQLRGTNVVNITVEKCSFIVPGVEGLEKRVDSIWFNGGISDITIKDCIVKNESWSTQYSGGIWISAGEGQTARNINILNNYIEKSSHDEALAFFIGTICDITVDGNTIYTHNEPIGNPSAHAIGFGVWDSVTTISNAIFSNNTIDIVASRDAIMFTDVDGIKIYNNKITLRNNSASDPVTYAIFRVTIKDEIAATHPISPKNVEIYNNDITVDNTESGGTITSLIYDLGSGFNVHDNTFTMNTDVSQIHGGSITGATFENNTVIFNKTIKNTQGYESSNIIINK